MSSSIKADPIACFPREVLSKARQFSNLSPHLEKSFSCLLSYATLAALGNLWCQPFFVINIRDISMQEQKSTQITEKNHHQANH
jgi:hypothetical protein